MPSNFSAIVDLLSCPDDGASLRYFPAEFRCTSCCRCFPIHGENLAEILPSRPYELPGSLDSGYRKEYLHTFHERYQVSEPASAWGAEETVAKSWARKRHRQVAMVKPLITEGSAADQTILCDISAGAGYYTFAYARSFRFVLHCDLSYQNLIYAWRKAQDQEIRNIFFLRIDYFAPPFQQTLDRMICFDTLIRGEAHDSALLSSIVRSLKTTGSAVVDFHNWWHNPLRRLGLLPENFGDNRSYRRAEAERLLRHTQMQDFLFLPFLQELDPRKIGSRLLSRIFPATRLIYLFTTLAAVSAARSSSLFEVTDESRLGPSRGCDVARL